jgi:hypothetical protein
VSKTVSRASSPRTTGARSGDVKYATPPYVVDAKYTADVSPDVL